MKIFCDVVTSTSSTFRWNIKLNKNKGQTGSWNSLKVTVNRFMDAEENTIANFSRAQLWWTSFHICSLFLRMCHLIRTDVWILLKICFYSNVLRWFRRYGKKRKRFSTLASVSLSSAELTKYCVRSYLLLHTMPFAILSLLSLPWLEIIKFLCRKSSFHCVSKLEGENDI